MAIAGSYDAYSNRYITSSEGKNELCQMGLNINHLGGDTYQGNMDKNDTDVNTRPVFSF
ncbi:MAG: hypothetical protein LUE99_07360 [Bacteroides sp.]|nr:hypothetical protein [Bacteroides sp.]